MENVTHVNMAPKAKAFGACLIAALFIVSAEQKTLKTETGSMH